MRSRSLAAPALIALAISAVAPPAPAVAHEGNPNFRSQVERDPPGVDARVLDFDDRLGLEVDPGREVVVLGYEDEPYLRFGAGGEVEVNTRSPARYLNEDRFANVELPRSARPGAPPSWEPVATHGRYGWHDHRIHWMSEGSLPPQVEDEGVETHVFDWRVPVVVDGERTAIRGTLTWVPDEGGPPLGVAFGLGGAVVASLALAVWKLRRRRYGASGGEDAW